MGDFTQCTGDGCPQKENCHRFTAKKYDYCQAMFIEVPLNKDKTCDHFWDNTPKKKTMGNHGKSDPRV